MRPALAAAALALLAACTGASSERSPAQLKIASWNLEHLAEHDGAGCRPRQAADYALLAVYAAQLDADVIALQEVENEAAARRVFPADRYDIVMSGQPYPSAQDTCGGEPAGRLFVPQRTGFAIRKGVGYTVNPPLEALNVSANRNRPVRWGVDVSIAMPDGRPRLRLLNVHLKSGCAAGAKPSDDDCPVLFRQVPIVEQWIDWRDAETYAFIVLGDFNRRLDLPGDTQVWQAWDDGDPAGLDLTSAASLAGAQPQCDGGRWDDFIDHIVLSSRAKALLVPGSFSELVFSERGDAMPSDHCPVSVTLEG